MNNISITENNRQITREIGKAFGKHRKWIGAIGEALIVKHLKGKGFVHIESNYLKKYGELDIIMENNGITHFIEVKTVSHEMSRSSTGTYKFIRQLDAFTPEENVSPRKMHKISRMIRVYIEEHRISEGEWQFDVGVVYLDIKNQKAVIKLIKDIPIGE